jgi:hypothetical protein
MALVALLTLVAVATLAVFVRTIGFDFLLWDDDIQLTNNPTLHQLDWVTAWHMLTHGYAIRYQPMSWLSSALLVKIGGLSPALFHGYNVVLHAASAVLLALILRRLLARVEGGAHEPGTLLWAPVVGALVFALHPLRAEPVAWATGWRYCQCVFFMLTSALLYLRAIDSRPSNALRAFGYWASVLAFALCVLTYPFCLEWPLVLVVLDVYPLRRWHTRQAKLEKLPFAALSLLALAASVAVRLSTQEAGFVPASLAQYGLGTRLMKAAQVWADATWRALLPISLEPVYVGSTPFDALAFRSIASATAVVGITVVLLRLRRRYPALLALWIIHAVLLGAKLGLLEAGHVEAADRFTYPAGIAWAGLAAVAFLVAGRLRSKMRRLRLPVAGILLVALGLASFHHASIWRDDITFFQAGLAGVGDSGLRDDMEWRLALARWRRGELDQAVSLLDDAVVRRPTDLRVRLMRAGLFEKLGRPQDSRHEIDAAMRLTGARSPEEAVRRLSGLVRSGTIAPSSSRIDP